MLYLPMNLQDLASNLWICVNRLCVRLLVALDHLKIQRYDIVTNRQLEWPPFCGKLAFLEGFLPHHKPLTADKACSKFIKYQRLIFHKSIF